MRVMMASGLLALAVMMTACSGSPTVAPAPDRFQTQDAVMGINLPVDTQNLMGATGLQNQSQYVGGDVGALGSGNVAGLAMMGAMSGLSGFGGMGSPVGAMGLGSLSGIGSPVGMMGMGGAMGMMPMLGMLSI